MGLPFFMIIDHGVVDGRGLVEKHGLSCYHNNMLKRRKRRCIKTRKKRFIEKAIFVNNERLTKILKSDTNLQSNRCVK